MAYLKKDCQHFSIVPNFVRNHVWEMGPRPIGRCIRTEFCQTQ